MGFFIDVEGGGSGTFIIQITVPSFLISSFCELVTLVNIWNKFVFVHQKIFYCDSYDINHLGIIENVSFLL